MKKAGLGHVRPYDLRHSFVSLLIAEGRSIVDVARQAGHSATMALDTYGHVFDELDGAERSRRRGDLGGAALGATRVRPSRLDPLPRESNKIPLFAGVS